MYKVLVAFDDLKDGNHRYEAGDIYPREGLKVTKKRIKELSSKENKRKKVLIVEVQNNEPTND